VAVVSKITLPWNTEVGYGAVAFDGTTLLNEALAADLGLAGEVVRRGIEETRAKVARRVAELRGAQFALDLSGRCAVVVDDGLASGFTMRTAVEALRRCGASRLLVAVPTGSLRAVERLAPEVDDLYCANVRAGHRFAVADAYEAWRDVGEDEARAIFERFRRSERARARKG
jgi:predicted phosphoribosyltransferase